MHFQLYSVWVFRTQRSKVWDLVRSLTRIDQISKVRQAVFFTDLSSRRSLLRKFSNGKNCCQSHTVVFSYFFRRQLQGLLVNIGSHALQPHCLYPNKKAQLLNSYESSSLSASRFTPPWSQLLNRVGFYGNKNEFAFADYAFDFCWITCSVSHDVMISNLPTVAVRDPLLPSMLSNHTDG